MFDLIFENRSRTLSNLIKLGTSLGRSLRENLILFSVDSENKTVGFLSESNKLIFGDYSSNYTRTKLDNIRIIEGSELEDSKKFDSYVKNKVSSFVSNLGSNKIEKAQMSFNELLGLFESRLRFNVQKEKLQAKLNTVKTNTNIVETVQYKRFKEIYPQIVSMIKENKNRILGIPEIKNTVQLSNIISESFDIPRLTYSDLTSFESNEYPTGTIFETICKQELVKKELLESKANFQQIWASSDKVKSLAENIYSEDDKIAKSLAEAIAEVPYIALVSKADLRNVITNTIDLHENIGIREKDIQKFISKLFEMKKPVKENLLALLNEKYGINIYTLKDTPSFKSLVNTQVVIFETLKKLSPKGSVVRSTLSEMSDMLKGKSGIQSLTLNEDILNLFEKAGIEVVEESALNQYLDFNRVADDLQGIGNILKMIQTQQQKQQMMQNPMGQPGMQQPGMNPAMGAMGQPNPVTAPDPMATGDDPTVAAAGPEDDSVMQPAMDPVQASMGGHQPPMGQDPMAGDAQMAPGQDMGGGVDPAMAGANPLQQGAGGGPEVSDIDMAGATQTLDALLQDLASQLGLGSEGDLMQGQGGLEDEPEIGEEDPEMGEPDMEEDPEMGEEGEEAPEEGFEEEDDETPEEGGGKITTKKFRLKGKDKELPVEDHTGESEDEEDEEDEEEEEY